MTESHLQTIIVLLVGIVVLVFTFVKHAPIATERKRRLDQYWIRACSGSAWRKNFPDESKDSIREFLECFVNSFAFSSKKRFKFTPHDKIMDVYCALYPSLDWGGDALELETFSINLEQRYKLNLAEVITDDLTLGQLFLMATGANPNQKNAPDRKAVR